MPKSEPPVEDPPAGWTSRTADFVLRYRLVLASLCLASSALGVQLIVDRLVIDPGIERMVDDGSEATSHPAKRTPSEIAVLVHGSVWTEDFLGRLQSLQQDLQGLSAAPLNADGTDAPLLFDETLSVLNVRQLEVDAEGTLRDRALSELLEDGVGSMRTAADADRAIAGRLVDAKGELALVLLRAPRLDDAAAVDTSAAVQRVVASHEHAGFRITLAGLPILKATMVGLLYRDIGQLFVLSVAISLLILVLTFRRLSAVVGPALVIGSSSAWTFGLMALLGAPLTIVGLYLPAVLTVVAIADSIHLQAVYAALRAEGRPQREAIVSAFATTAVPMLYTSITTCVGLLGLRAASIEAIREVGTFGAIGVASAFVHTLVLVPTVLSLDSDKPWPAQRAAGQRWLDGALRTISRLSAPASGGSQRWLRLALAVCVISAVGVSQLRIHHEMIEWLPRGNSLAPAVAQLDSQLAGSAMMTLQLDFAQAGTLKRHQTLQHLREIEQAALAYRVPESEAPLVRDVNSVLDVVRGAWRCLSEQDATPGALPPSAEQTAGTFQFLELLGARELNRFAAADGSWTQMTMRMRWTDAGTYGGLIEAVEQAAHNGLGASVRARVVGPVADMNRAVNALLGDLMRSFLVSAIGVALALLLLLRDLRLALLAMVPNVMPIVMVLGLMGFAGYPLDVHTMLMSSVLMGIVVDDTIHFLHHFQKGMRETGGDPEASLEASFRKAGRALVVTSVTLSLGFLTCLGSSLQHMQRTGLLLGFAIVLALAIDLVLTPALLRRYAGNWGATPHRQQLHGGVARELE